MSLRPLVARVSTERSARKQHQEEEEGVTEP